MAFSKNRRLADLVSSAGEVSSFVDASVTHADLHTSMDLTGKTVTVANASTGDNDTTAANTAFVQQEIAALVDSAPGTLNTLNELAAALGDDASFSTTVTDSIATKLPLAGGTLTGNLIGTQAFFSPNTAGKNTITITTNAVDDGRIRIKSNTTDKVDIQANGISYFNGGNVGIGTTSPSTALHVSAGDGSAELTVARTGTYASSWSLKPYNADFFIRESGSDRVTIKAGGNVGIGTGSPSKKLAISNGGAQGIELSPEESGVSRIFSYNRSSNAYTPLNIQGEYIMFGTGTSNAERVRINAEGIAFNGDSAAANSLDDYEEGTWTPDLRNHTSSFSTQTWNAGPTAVYTKIGDLVYIHLSGRLSAVAGNGTGEFRIFGLPFVPRNTGGYQEFRLNFILGNQPTASDSYAAFAFVRNGGTDFGTRLLNGADTIFQANRIDNDTFFSIYGCYKTAS